jgi:hypothetical protein
MFGPTIRQKNRSNPSTDSSEKKWIYHSVKKDISLDMERLIKGGYTIDEILEIKEYYLGKYEGYNVYVKIGKYGPYIEYGETRKSLKQFLEYTQIESLEKIELEQMIDFIQNPTKYEARPLANDNTVTSTPEVAPFRIEDAQGQQSNPFISAHTRKEGILNEKWCNGENVAAQVQPLQTNKNLIRYINDEMSIRKGKYGSYIFYKRPNMKDPQFLKLRGFPLGYSTCPLEILEDWIYTTYNLPRDLH